MTKDKIWKTENFLNFSPFPGEERMKVDERAGRLSNVGDPLNRVSIIGGYHIIQIDKEK